LLLFKMKFSIAAAALAATATTVVAAPAPGKVDLDALRCKLEKVKLPANSKLMQAAVTKKNLLKGAQKLQDIAYATEGRNRVMGSVGHNNTVKYLVDTLNSLGGFYKVETQKFQSLVMANGTGSLTVNNAVVDTELFEYSPSGQVTADLVVVNNFGCDAADYPASVSGKIALISRGTCEFGAKSARAGAAGAVGALIYNNAPGALSGTLGAPPRPEGPYVATLGLSQEQGQAYAAQIAAGTAVTGTLDVETVIETFTTNNVLATTVCGDHDNTLVIGAHSDSVAAGPGINDDGSGTIGILEVAKLLAFYKVNNAVRFGFWSGEEQGLLGSTFYVNSLSDAEKAKVRAYLNFDMIASPNYINAIYDGDGSSFGATGPAGSGEIEKFFQDFFKSKGQNFTATAYDGRSDYAAFIDNGIPGGGTFTGAEELKTPEEAQMFGGQAGVALDVNYHAAGDTVANLNMDAFLLHTKSIAASVATYANSFKSLPPKEAVTKRSSGAQRKYRGGKLIM
jgi:Zn-dependent M28 family amino/carboxypeptidase